MTEAGMRTLSHSQLRACWRIPSVEGLVRCLRLGWLQKMIEDKEGTLQVLAAVFGRLEGEKQPT
eukprot:1174727-Heterocapsa_arctica.AAC.1